MSSPNCSVVSSSNNASIDSETTVRRQLSSLIGSLSETVAGTNASLPSSADDGNLDASVDQDSNDFLYSILCQAIEIADRIEFEVEDEDDASHDEDDAEAVASSQGVRNRGCRNEGKHL